MGFGILFIGFLVSFFCTISPMYYFTDLIGYLLLAYALIMLSYHNRNFRRAMVTAFCMLPFGLAELVLGLLPNFGLAVNLPVLDGIITGGKMVVQIVFFLFLWSAIRELAVSTELPKLVRRARFSLALTIMFYVGNLAFTVLSYVHAETAQIFLMPLLILRLVWIAVCAVLIFSCYMWICFEGDENMEAPASKLSLVNRMNALLNKKGEKADRGDDTAGAQTHTDGKNRKKKSRK